MAITPNTITSANVVKATFSEYISRYQEDYDRFAEMVGLFPLTVVKAGEQLYKYVVTGELNDGATDPGTIIYEKTRDTDIVPDKAYYTRTGTGTDSDPYVYEEVDTPAKADLEDYYIAYAAAGSSSGRRYVEGDEVALTEFKLERVFLGKSVFFPYRTRITAQAIQDGGFENAFMRFTERLYRNLKSDTVSDIFNWINLFDEPTIASPAAGSTWNLQQMLAHTEDTLLNTLEANRENDSDFIHFLNRSDVYDYLADATITTQDLFGMTYLENFLGINRIFLSNRITKGTMVATPVSNLRSYGIDFAELAKGDIEYQTDGSGIIGFAYDKAMSHVSTEIHAIRTLTITPEKEPFVVRGSMTHVA